MIVLLITTIAAAGASFLAPYDPNAQSISIRLQPPLSTGHLLGTDQLGLFLPPEREGKYAIARFKQKYQSSNFKTDINKILYMKKGQGGWHIIGESSF